jgi:IS30 family transposase
VAAHGACIGRGTTRERDGKDYFCSFFGINGKRQVITRELIKLPLKLRKTLTWDRGMEMAKHASFTIATDMAVYFCDPQSPWQRGTNENTNRLLRQYFPKKTPLDQFTQDDLDKVALELNERPRKTLGYKTPSEVISNTVAMTH